MKIAFVLFTDMSRDQGDSVHVKNLLVQFERCGLSVDAIASQCERRQLKSAKLNFIKKILGRVGMLPKVLLARRRYDLFYIRDWLFAYVLSFCKTDYAFEINGLLCFEGLVRGHFGQGSRAHRAFARIEDRVIRRATKIVCVSQGMKDYCIEHGADAGRILVAENAAEAEVFHPGVVKAKIDIPAGNLVVGWMGSFDSYHGMDDLIEIAEYLKGKGTTDISFLVIGGGKRKEQLQRRIVEKGLAECFVFCGALAWKQVPSHMANADLCLSLDRRTPENLDYRNTIGVTTIKVYEYLALGKPVLAHNLGNARRFFEDRQIGWACDIEPDAVAQKILEISGDRERIAGYAANAARVSAATYTWARTTAKIVAFLEQPVPAV